MKRNSDEIRYKILEVLEKKGKTNLETVRSEIGTGLPTMLNNLKVMENWNWVKVFKTDVGKRFYREIQITNYGREFINKYRKLFRKGGS